MNGTVPSTGTSPGPIAALAVAVVVLTLSIWGGRVPPEIRELTVTLSLAEGFCHFTRDDGADGGPAELAPRRLNVALGTAVRLRVVSRDVVYFVKQESLGIDLPAIPETVFETSFTAPEPGRYDLTLNPVCGLPWKHAEAPGTIIVSTR